MQHLAELRTYRNELKGLAILWVVFFHAQLNLTGLLFDIQKIGYGGVDIFLFLSGFGLFHSFEKSTDLHGYVSRRMGRLLPAYLPFCFAWLLVMLPMLNLGTVQSIRVAMGNLMMIGFFADVPQMINWYISVLLLTLVIAPLLYACLKRAKRPALTTLTLLIVAFCIGLCFLFDDRYMAVSRLPIFILGMAFAMPIKQELNKHVERAVYLISFTIGVVALLLCFERFSSTLNDYGMYWHPFVFIIPAFCIGISWFFHKIEKIGKLFAPLRFLGKASFEIFLFNCWAELLCKRFGMAKSVQDWVLWSLGSIAAGCVYHLIVNACVKSVKESKKKAEITA